MSAMVAELAVRKSITVAAPPERAFEVFTDRIGTWWPLDTHSLFEDRAVTAVVEPREGGGMYELDADGNQGYWGTILAWEPPHRLVVSWNVGRRRPEPTEVEVRFVAEGDGTRVELEHRGWERIADGDSAYARYDAGWDTVLAPYIGAVAQPASGASE
jgi:uncharacterized protein YndB with AHSA1/START domain